MNMHHSDSCRYNQGQNAAPLRPRLSLTLWLTFSNALSAFLLTSFIAAVLYLVLTNQLHRQNYRHLHHETKCIQNLLQLEESLTPFIAEVSEEPLASAEYIKRYIRLQDTTGRILMQSRDMAALIPPRIFPVPKEKGTAAAAASWRNKSGRKFVTTALLVELPGEGGECVLQVALDVTHEEEVLEACREWIYLVLLLALLLSGGISFLIARSGTRPLKEMREMVRRITVTNLEERIPARKWPRELDAMADALNLMLDRLEDSFKRLYLSATNLSHKMRTPLTILRGEAEVALSKSRSAEELEDVIASSLEEVTRLSRLGENILFLGNAEMGNSQLERSLLDCREEAEQVVDYHAPSAEEKGITITCEGDASVMADGPLFRKLLAALVSNAVTYNASGGTVTVSLRQREPLSAELIVTDTGIGIPASEMLKVFDRFYRIYATRHKDPHGTGLGLPMAQAIVDLHHGSISLNSIPGEGTTVTVIFPAHPAAAVPAASPPAS